MTAISLRVAIVLPSNLLTAVSTISTLKYLEKSSPSNIGTGFSLTKSIFNFKEDRAEPFFSHKKEKIWFSFLFFCLRRKYKKTKKSTWPWYLQSIIYLWIHCKLNFMIFYIYRGQQSCWFFSKVTDPFIYDKMEDSKLWIPHISCDCGSKNKERKTLYLKHNFVY